MSFLKKIFGKEPLESKKSAETRQANVEFSSFNYPPKILVAWIKALEGNQQFNQYFYENGYQEIFYLNQALHLNQQARDWMMNNGYPHLMAFVNAAEGNGQAQHWLKMHGFEFLYYSALAIEDEAEGFNWLKLHSNEIIFGLIKTMKHIKDGIEFNHNDVHSFGKDL